MCPNVLRVYSSAVCEHDESVLSETELCLLYASSAGVSFNSVYTQIWRVLLHLAADPFPEVSDLAMKVLNSIAYKVCIGPWTFQEMPCSKFQGGAQELLIIVYQGVLYCDSFSSNLETSIFVSNNFLFAYVSVDQFCFTTWLCGKKRKKRTSWNTHPTLPLAFSSSKRPLLLCKCN